MSNISSTGFRSPLTTGSSLLSAFSGQQSQLIRCDIVFGMPSQDCRGTGICKLSSDLFLQQPPAKNCRHTVAFVSGCDIDPSRVRLLFFREFLCIDLFRRQFRNGIFAMPESCPIPEALAKDLGMNISTLLPGNYSVQEAENCFIVDIDCQ
ncbi:MAG: hypothetical protein H6565_13145 [Lewinellaceae bacterium]|nr:hypothetical protein [Saprospiraceae bacterium]MCB9307535.1 hypothetical protein [Lewinellaceae bacterium]